MTNQAIAVTIIASLLSGLLGIAISSWYFYRLERYKQRIDLARRLLGNRFDLKGDAFSTAINEVIAVFSNNSDVLNKMSRFHEILASGTKSTSDAALVDLLKAVSKASGLSQATLNDTYLLKVFNARAQQGDA